MTRVDENQPDPPSPTGLLSDRRYPATLLLGGFILFLAIYRVSLTRTGHFFWGDEIRYLRAGEMIDDVARGEYCLAAGRMFQSLGRPGFILISAVPTLISRISYDAPSNPLEPFDIAAVCNVLVSIGVTIMIYLLARGWRWPRAYALLAAVVYSLLAQSNVWIRHLVPYNHSLLMFLSALWLITRVAHEKTRRWPTLTLVLAGMLSAFGFATYPGHYMFAAINFVCVLVGPQITTNRADEANGETVSLLRSGTVPRVTAFAAGGMVTVSLFEGLARFAGTTWVGSGGQFSPTMGLFSEGYAFAWHYLSEAEGVIGHLLTLGFAAYAVRLLLLRERTIAAVAILSAIACYLAHATLGVVFHKTVFYGRILLMYLPFIVFGAIAAIMTMKSLRRRYAVIGAVLIASTASFVNFGVKYARLTYPADLWYCTAAVPNGVRWLSPEELYGSSDGSPLGILDATGSSLSLAMVADTKPEGSDAYIPLTAHQNARQGGYDVIGVNLRWMFYIAERDERFAAPERYRMVAEAKHPLTFAPLQFEGFRPCERKRFQERQYTMRIYRRDVDASSVVAPQLADRSN